MDVIGAGQHYTVDGEGRIRPVIQCAITMGCVRSARDLINRAIAILETIPKGEYDCSCLSLHDVRECPGLLDEAVAALDAVEKDLTDDFTRNNWNGTILLQH